MTESRAPKRDKHPARSARILSTGLALTSTLGLSAAYTLAAQAKALNNVGMSDPAAAVDPALVPAGSVAQTPAVAPSTPTGATPVTGQSSNKVGGIQQTVPGAAAAIQTPVSAAAPQDAGVVVIQVPVSVASPAPVAASPAPVAAAPAPVAAAPAPAPAPAPVVTVAPKTSSSK
ncbi:MAG: hypothetical protein WCH38_07505 [Actinomycetota bacterium]